MDWETIEEVVPGTRLNVYVAEILGPDPKYRFKRRFLDLECIRRYDGRLYFGCPLEKDGVYESSTKRVGHEGKLLERRREWFVIFDGESYPLDDSELLFTLFNLQAQS